MKSHFSQSGQVFLQYWVFEAIFEARRKNLRILLYSKRPSRCHGFNAKIGLKNGPLWAEIFEKNQNGVAVWFGGPCLKTFLQISRARVVRFSNRFLHWNRGIETVVLSTIKGTNGVFKNPKIFPASLNFASISLNFWRIQMEWAKMEVIFVFPISKLVRKR